MAVLANAMIVRDTSWTRSVRLHGDAGEEFGTLHSLAVKTPAEAIRAIQANHPRFFVYLKEMQEKGVGFAVILRDKYDRSKRYSLKSHELTHPIGDRELDIIPMPEGAGDNPVVQIIVGVILIAVAVVLAIPSGGTSLAGLGAILGGEAGFFATAAFSIGVGLAIGGISQLLTPTPDIGSNQLDVDDGKGRKPSFAFAGAVNTAAQGRAVPIGYGELIIGSHVISVGIKNVTPAPPAVPEIDLTGLNLDFSGLNIGIGGFF